MMFVEAKVVDSTHLELSKPIAERQGRIILVAVAEGGEEDAERQQWLAASAPSLYAACGDSEPDYKTSMIRESNPGYRR
jgi:hypothetical protein